MKVVAFGHRKNVGKDLAASLLYQNLRCDHPTMKIEVAAFADPLYEIAHKLYHWDGFRTKQYYDQFPHTKNDVLKTIGKSVRRVLIDLGLCIRQDVYLNTWVDYTLKKHRDVELLIITDLRFPNEFHMVKDLGGICVRVDRPSILITDDLADAALADEKNWDHIISNEGTKRDLNTKAVGLWELINK